MYVKVVDAFEEFKRRLVKHGVGPETTVSEALERLRASDPELADVLRAIVLFTVHRGRGLAAGSH